MYAFWRFQASPMPSSTMGPVYSLNLPVLPLQFLSAALLTPWLQTPGAGTERVHACCCKRRVLGLCVRSQRQCRSQCPPPHPEAHLLRVVQSLFHLRHDGLDVVTFIDAWKQSVHGGGDLSWRGGVGLNGRADEPTLTVPRWSQRVTSRGMAMGPAWSLRHREEKGARSGASSQ